MMMSTQKILEKALKQLKREEDMIHHVIRDVCELSCHKLIALPNLMRKSVKAALQNDPKLLEVCSFILYKKIIALMHLEELAELTALYLNQDLILANI